MTPAMSSPMQPAPHPLTPTEWRSRIDQHRARAQRWTLPARERRAAGQSHPVADFLTTYYFTSLNQLEQWHPGPAELLTWDEPMPSWLRRPPYLAHPAAGILVRHPPDPPASRRLREIRELLAATRSRPAHYGCFGLHEWAMVYQGRDIRHRQSCRLRLTQQEIDAVVESQPLTCTHFDAFRFFHPATQPRNRFQPTLARRPALEQPGCIHANMDLYKWAGKAMPWIGADLLLDAFDLAIQLREVDMRASPYDLRPYGLMPIRIETETGRRQYAALQQSLRDRAAPLRDRLIAALDQVVARNFPPAITPAATPPPRAHDTSGCSPHPHA